MAETHVGNDYEIVIQDYASGEYINLGSDGNFCNVRFDGVGSPELREAVWELSGDDGVRFGTEYYGAINWNITGSIHSGANKSIAGDASVAWNTWSQLSRAWIGYPQRLIPRGVVPLYFKRPGREQMVVFGRPSRIDPITDRSYAGLIAYTAQFRQSDPRFYSAEDKEIVVGAGDTYAGGFIVNDGTAIKLPFTTTVATPAAGAIFNDGDAPTQPVIIINGEVTNPIVSYIDGSGDVQWSVVLQTVIPEGHAAVIDTRQWERSITRQIDGTSLDGAYVGDRLQDITILPGSGQIQYGATASSPSTYVRVSYKDAWVST